jgi:hypothetical protein
MSPRFDRFGPGSGIAALFPQIAQLATAMFRYDAASRSSLTHHVRSDLQVGYSEVRNTSWLKLKENASSSLATSGYRVSLRAR